MDTNLLVHKVDDTRLCRTETKQGELMRLWVLVTKFMAEFCNPIVHLNVKNLEETVRNPFGRVISGRFLV